MPNYQNSKIYKLWSPQGEEDEIYIGSTTQLLYMRKSHHKNKSSLCKSKILFEKYDDVRIEVIEEYPCNSKAELLKKEGEHIRNNKCLNKIIPDRTKKEYYEDNKEYIKLKSKDYTINHKEKISEKKKEYYENNKEKIKEYKKQHRENNKEYIKEKLKEWRENNKEYIKEKSKEYRENNKEYLLKKNKEWYEKNKEEYNKKRRK
jgi:hypothetical protein